MPAAPTQPTAKRSRRGRLSDGAPTKKTPEMLSRISEAVSLGLTDEETCNFVGIETDTLVRWKKDPEFYGAIKRRDRHQTCSAAEKDRNGRRWMAGGSLGDGEIDAAALFEILAVLRTADVPKRVLLHGANASAWPLSQRAVESGFSTRIGLEDVKFLPDGSPAESNTDLVAAAMRMIQLG